MNTFISFVGKGSMDKQHSGYLKTQYDFGDGVVQESAFFADAVRLSGKYEFDEVLLIGTETSGWSALLESGDASELWETLWERELEQLPLTADSLWAEQLKSELEKRWRKPVRLRIHSAELLSENCFKIFEGYVEDLLRSENDLLLDITHSLRWMPVLLIAAQEFRRCFPQTSGEVKIIYGELRRGENSPVRCLDVLIQGQRTAEAITLFFQKFEAGPLSEILFPHWESGAKSIKKIGEYLQGNFLLPLLWDRNVPGFEIGRPLKQLKNALNDFGAIETPPYWVSVVGKELQIIYDRLSAPKLYDRMQNLAELFKERKLYGQACLALNLASEQCILSCMGIEDAPEYEELKKVKHDFRKEFPECGKALSEIDNLRNTIAHGALSGGASKNPQAENLPGQYEKMLRNYQTILQCAR